MGFRAHYSLIENFSPIQLCPTALHNQGKQKEVERAGKTAMAMAMNMHIPDGLVAEILSCLPVKSLLRFRCVCKSWCVLIENPDFISKHFLKRNTLNNNAGNLFVKYEESFAAMICSLKVVDNEEIFTVAETISVPSRHPSLKICGPRNGILCLHRPGSYEDIVLWNPSTRDFRTLPKSPLEPLDISETTFGGIGFGFDHRTNDYKVIRFVYYSRYDDDDDYEEITQVELYSLKSDSWRLIPPMDKDISPRFHSYNTYKDGVYYWWAWKASDGSQWVISFDMVDEVFETVALLSKFRILHIPVFSFFNGQLCWVRYRYENAETFLEIWAMNDNGVKKTWVELKGIRPLAGFKKPVKFWKNSGLFLVDDQGELFLYDICTKEMKNLQFRGQRDTFQVNLQLRGVGRRVKFQVVNYEESLVPINGRRAHQ